MSEVKRCTKCGEIKPLDAYHQNRYAADGRKSQCKACRNVAKRAYLRGKGLSGPRHTYPQLYDYEWLARRYQIDLMSPTEIAGIIGCASKTVNAAIRRAGITTIPAGLRQGLRVRRGREGIA